MRFIHSTLLTCLLGFTSTCTVPAAPCDDLTKLINKTYGFSPAKLTPEQREAKSNEMDQVWKLVDSDPKKYLPCIRTEIDKRTSDSFFRFNASNLLFANDESIETKRLMIETYAGADLDDINLRYWLPYIARFGFEGLDVSKAGETWLRYPDPTFYLPQHGTQPIDKSVGALAIYGSMDEAMSLPALLRLVEEEDTDFRHTVVWLLVNQATAESHLAVRRLSEKLPKPLSDQMLKDLNNPELIAPREGKAVTTREEFILAMNELINGKPEKWLDLTVGTPEGERDMVAVLSESDIPLLRKVRRFYASNATPHSPDWYLSFTQIINTLRAKQVAGSNN
jgi:hypothetical protein